MASISRQWVVSALILAAAVAPAEQRKMLISGEGLNAGEWKQTDALTQYFSWGSVTKVVAEAGTSNVIWATSTYNLANTTVRACTDACEFYDDDSTKLYDTHRNQEGGFIGASVTAMMLDTTNSRRHLLLGLGFATDSAEAAVRLDLANNNAKTVLLAGPTLGWYFSALAFVPGDDYAFVFTPDFVSDNLTLSICDYGASAPCSLQQIASFAPEGNMGSRPECAYYHKATSTLYWGQTSSNNYQVVSTVVDKTSINSVNFVQAQRDRWALGSSFFGQCHLEADLAADMLYFSLGNFLVRYDMTLAGSWLNDNEQWPPTFPSDSPDVPPQQINGFAIDDRTAAADPPVPTPAPSTGFALKVTSSLAGVTADQLKANLAGFRTAVAQVHSGKAADDIVVDEASIVDVTTARRRLLADGVSVDYAIQGFADAPAAAAAKAVQEGASTALFTNLKTQGFDSLSGVTSTVDVLEATSEPSAAAHVGASWTWAVLASVAVLVVAQ